MFPVVLLALTLASCSSAPDVPSRWPVALGNDDCHAMVGRYAVTGEGDSGYAPRLSGYVFPATVDPQTASRAYRADRIEIVRDDTGSLRARAILGTDELASRPLQCDKGVAHVSAAPAPAGDSLSGIDKLETRFVSAADGALLVLRSESAGGVYGAIIPANLNEANWYRFARITTP